ncbi:MAG: di-heme oxidoredictase family protein [Deltaproteobacteria bacterium]|nr:di-heme oxidoredictase family protein [Deltaproteobacteria bacterium]
MRTPILGRFGSLLADAGSRPSQRSDPARRSLLCLALLTACGEEVVDVVDPPTEAAVVDEAIAPPPRDAVAAGRALFLHSWTRGDERARGGDGLGPLFNASSCVACHSAGGAGGAGGNHLNVVIGDGRVFHRHGGGPLPTAGSLIGIGGLGTRGGRLNDPPAHQVKLATSTADISGGLDRAIADRVGKRFGSQMLACYQRALSKDGASGKVSLRLVVNAAGAVSTASVSSTLQQAGVEACMLSAIRRASFGAGSAPSVVVVSYLFAGTRQPPPPPPPPGVVVERSTPALFGDGLIDAIPEEVIEAGASTSIAGHPEITGKVGRDAEGRVTRFGWKADVADLLTFVSRACSVELGLEVPGSPQPGPRKKRLPGLDIDLQDLEDLVAYVRALPRPIEQRTPIASEGAELFDSIGCTGCHTAALGDVDGLYSDLLLHDMGEELDDNASVGYYGAPPTSGSNEWRTAPLWGARDSAPYLHDGRARTLQGAIALHGGEAWKTRQSFYALDDDGRFALIAFLESLQAPRADD